MPIMPGDIPTAIGRPPAIGRPMNACANCCCWVAAGVLWAGGGCAMLGSRRTTGGATADAPADDPPIDAEPSAGFGSGFFLVFDLRLRRPCDLR